MGKIMRLTILLLLSHQVIAAEDPTAPLAGHRASMAEVQQAPLPELQSIVCQKECYVVLNNQVLSVGENIQGYQIAKVTDSSVILMRGKQRWELQLFSLDIKN
ncbi:MULTISPECIES: MSHA biogenesis protein MshK [unclassified Vibrio]|uniref:MSHA biogenesis protein MshK n=1 Tax=unclassified Vibrio TaxID=2614977 RepID=UPI003075DB52